MTAHLYLLALTIAVAACAILSSSAFAAEHNDVIDLSIQHQEIDNFGASDCWTFQKIGGWSETNKNRIADLLFSTDKGIGLSLWRFNIGGGINRQSIRDPWRTAETFEVAEGQYDWTRQASERWFAKAAKERGVPHLLAFVNSPPGRMTRNGLTNSGEDRSSTTNLKSGMEPLFARYLCDVLEHFRTAPENERLVFDYISPVNEPQVEWAAGNNHEGNRASNEDIKRMLVALHQEITARELAVKITAPESNVVPAMWQLSDRARRQYGADYGNYLEVFARDPQVAPMLGNLLCYHDYSSFEGESVIKHHEELGRRLKNYPGWKLWMSEVCILNRGRDLGMNMALQVARLIHADLALSNASAWQWWLALSRYDYKDGLIYTNWRRAGDEESVIESKTLWTLGNFSRYIRPGMRRVELSGNRHSFDALLGSAYIDASSGKLVLVYINSSKEPQTVKWSVKPDGGAPKNFSPYMTSESGNLEPTAAVTLGQAVEIPAQSVVTFVGLPDKP
jgi:O-glycosyl hydrolase